MGHDHKKVTDMTTTFCTVFPGWLLIICLVLIGCVLLFLFLRVVAAFFYVLFIMLKYALTGRWKEYMEKCKTDPDALR